jgi:hypothetical protein
MVQVLGKYSKFASVEDKMSVAQAGGAAGSAVSDEDAPI